MKINLLVYFSAIIYLIYMTTVIYKYGIPKSISETYYLFEKSKKGAGVLFTIFCWMIVFSLLPVWIQSSPEKYQFLAFLAGSSLAFVGSAAQFKEDFIKKVHFGAAGICAICALLWLILNSLWGFIIGAAILMIIINIIIGVQQVRYSWLFQLESIAFISLLTGLIYHTWML